MFDFEVRPTVPADREWMAGLLAERWGSPLIVSRGRAHNALELPGFAAWANDLPAGLTTYRIEGDECELVTLDSLREGGGIGAALVEAVRQVAQAAGCRRLFLVTTNDNLKALHFYQKRGFALVALYRGALEESRRLKPQIPLIGLDGIPLRDELELELLLTG